MSSGPWSIERWPSVIRTGRVISITILTLLGVGVGGGGHKTNKQPEITLPNLGTRSIRGSVVIDLCLTLFK